LDAGLYHYHGLEHALYRLPSSSDQIAPLIKDAAVAMGQPESPPQCVVLLASRLPRLAWKYQAIAYRITLMNAGVIFQTLYLVATAMNLACSALGNGNSVSFAKATGLDPLEETSVAEFALGSLSQPAGSR
jgi:SagB-type dehydrogenase family enzyme